MVSQCESRLIGYARESLLRAMEDYSEDTMCAGWIANLEYTLWRDILRAEASTSPRDSDRQVGYRLTLADWLNLIDDSGGWWVWDDKADNFRRFVPLADWREIYAKMKGGE